MLFCLLLMSFTMPTQPAITYHVHMSAPELHYFNVSIEVAPDQQPSTDWFIPVWTPGSYLVREFAKNIDSVTAVDAQGNAVDVQKINKNTWRVNHLGKPYNLLYRVYAFEESVRTSFLDDTRAAIMPTSTLLYPADADVPVTIQLYPPNHWTTISTPLKAAKDNPWLLYAAHRDELYDSPIEIGNQEVYSFTAAGKPHYLVMIGKGNYSIDTILPDLTAIVEAQTAIFGENPTGPYYFIVNNTATRGGGLEHANASCNQFPRDGYSGEGYSSFLALMSHEYFHIWNVKRLRPVELGPFDYSNENYTTGLWVAEGFTSYYDDHLLLRTGIYSEETYLNNLSGSISSVLNNPGDAVQSVAASSFDAWIKAYRRNENSGNTEVSYYTKGSILAFLLDLMIIEKSNGNQTLDDALQAAWEQLYKQNDKGYTEDDFRRVLEQFTGVSLEPFYAAYVHGTSPLNMEPYLTAAGLELLTTADTSAWWGMRMGAGNVISSVDENGPAAMGRLNTGDQILALNNIAVSQSFAELSGQYAVGDIVTVTVNRRGITRSFNVTVAANPRVMYQLQPVANPTEIQLNNFKTWKRLAH